MRRREFITLLGGTAAWPLRAHAQQGDRAVVGYLHSGAAGPFAHLVAVFREALKETGYVEGQNLLLEYRWANGEYDRLQALATELVRRQVAVIVRAGGSVSALAAKKATASRLYSPPGMIRSEWG
jgi:putative tryptophan/tyrosine transport system substrate-binding protein